MRRKGMVLPALLAVVCFLSGGCGGERKGREEAPAYEILMQWPGEGDVYEGLPEVEAALSEITRKEIGATVRFLPSMATTYDASLMIEKGEKLDLCVSLYGGMPRLVSSHYLMELDGLLDTVGHRLKDLCQVQMAGGRYQGHFYGIPTTYTQGHRYGLLCRRDLWEKYGWPGEEDEKIWSFEELEAFFRKVKAGEGLCILGGNLATEYHFLERSMISFDTLGADVSSGVLLLGPEGDGRTIVDLYETEAFQSFAETMYRWNQEGFFLPDTALCEYSPNTLIREGKAIAWFFGNVPGEETENALDSGHEAVFLPTQEACRCTDMYQQILWSIPITCPDPEKVLSFLELWYTDERVSNLLQRGIEGRSYVVVEEGEGGKVIDLPEGETIDTIPYYAYLNAFGNRMDIYNWAPASVDRRKVLERFSEEISLTSPALGYVFDQEPVALELGRLREVEEKYLGLIETGAVDPAYELPLFLAEWKEAGIDRVIEENQRQYDLFLSQMEKTKEPSDAGMGQARKEP